MTGSALKTQVFAPTHSSRSCPKRESQPQRNAGSNAKLSQRSEVQVAMQNSHRELVQVAMQNSHSELLQVAIQNSHSELVQVAIQNSHSELVQVAIQNSHREVQVAMQTFHREVQVAIQDSRLLYYLIRKIKTWLNINHITVHNNTYCIF